MWSQCLGGWRSWGSAFPGLGVVWVRLHRLEATALSDGIFSHRLEVDAQGTPLYNEDILKKMRIVQFVGSVEKWGWTREDGVFGIVVK